MSLDVVEISSRPSLSVQAVVLKFDLKGILHLLNGWRFYDIYCGSLRDTLYGKASIFGDPLAWHTYLNILGHNFHSLESLVCLNSLSASLFIVFKIYSAVIMILLCKR